MQKQYTFNREGVPETVEPEVWGWGVVYKDGTELKQFGDDGVFHQFREIDQSNVDMFVMYRLDNEDTRIDTMVSEGTKIFHFYRNLILQSPIMIDTEEMVETRRLKVYIFGTKNQNGTAQYNYILPDGRILKADHDIPDLTSYNI